MKTLERDVTSRKVKRKLAAADTRQRITISFYRYVNIADPEAFRVKLLQKCGAL